MEMLKLFKLYTLCKQVLCVKVFSTDKLILHIFESTYFKLVVDKTFIYYNVRESYIDVCKV